MEQSGNSYTVLVVNAGDDHLGDVAMVWRIILFMYCVLMGRYTM
jgi:hypothetical protein